jgi:hypothetical protein
MSGVERFGSNLTLLSLSFARRGDGNLTLSLCPSPSQGEGRFGGSRNRVRSGQVGKKQQAQQGEKPHPVCFADIPLLHKGEGIATSPCCPSPSQRRGTFWRKPKQGEVRTGGQETTGSTRRETSPCLLRRHPSPSQRRGNSLSFFKGEGRFGESQNRVRSGQVGKKQQAQQGEKPHPVCFADIPLLQQRRGNCDLTLLSLSFNKERDVLAKAKTG